MRLHIVIPGALALLAGAFALFGPTAAWSFRIWCGLLAAVMALDLVVRPDRYKPVTRLKADERWKATGERFVDTESGRMVDVQYDSESGERRYVEATPDAPTSRHSPD